MKWIGFALVALSFATPSFAFPHINTISSETLSTSPLRVKTTFTVQLVGYEPHSYWAIDVTPVQGSTFQLVDCAAPVDWFCNVPAPGMVTLVPTNSVPWPWPGIYTFSIVTDQAAPCVDMDFANGILGKTPQTNQDYVVTGCLAVDAPTPAAPASWGAVKAIYR